MNLRAATRDDFGTRMRLYHFTSAVHGLQAIRNKRIKIARINELNDPFEFLPYDIRDPELRWRLDQHKNDVDKRVGLICLGATWHNPLLWGHYADKHKGVCLEFEVPPDVAFAPVQYLPRRMPWRPDRQPEERDILHIVHLKYVGWAYEEEYRGLCILADEEFDPETGLYFTKFNDGMRLSKVIVGARSDVARSQVEDALKAADLNVPSFKARPAFGKFEVVENLDHDLWK